MHWRRREKYPKWHLRRGSKVVFYELNYFITQWSLYKISRRKKEKKYQLFLDEAEDNGNSEDEEDYDDYDRERQEEMYV